MAKKNYHFDTLLVHGGYEPEPGTQAMAVPVYQTTAYEFDSAEQAAKRFALREFGNMYTRLTNPTTAVFEERMALIEGGTAAVAVSSGHSAQFLVVNSLCRTGDNIVSSPFLYGGSYVQFAISFKNWGIEGRFAKDDSAEEMEKLIDNRTRMLYVENMGNPAFNIPDFEKLAALARKYDIPLVVDNTFGCGGYLCSPIKHGANIVTESATKWIGGHGNSMGGVIIDGGNYNWGNGKYPKFSEPSESYAGLVFWDTFGESCPLGNIAFATLTRAEGLRDMGSCQSPFNSFMLIQGLETLSVRVGKICENTLELARWLQQHPAFYEVSYPGLESHPYHAMAQKYFHNGFGGVLTFRVRKGKERAQHFIEYLELISHVTNVGDVRSLITHPASTTHQQLSEEAQIAAGVYPDLCRLSVGLEHIDDLKEDIKHAIKFT